MGSYKRIANLENEIEAQILISILNERRIPHLVKTYHDPAYVGIFQMHKGWGFISASSCYEEEIREILRDLRKEMEGE